jgi:hypothetical protein
MPIISTLKQEDLDFQASLGYKVRPCLKNEETEYTQIGNVSFNSINLPPSILPGTF